MRAKNFKASQGIFKRELPLKTQEHPSEIGKVEMITMSLHFKLTDDRKSCHRCEGKTGSPTDHYPTLAEVREYHLQSQIKLRASHAWGSE
jgi:hypothetical protein